MDAAFGRANLLGHRLSAGWRRTCISCARGLVRSAMGQMNLSARGYHRALKLARTIADLAGSEQIQAAHLAEALQYRPKLMLN